MQEQAYSYIIIGAGLAGVSAAEGIRQIDPHGSILLLGAEITAVAQSIHPITADTETHEAAERLREVESGTAPSAEHPHTASMPP